MNERFLIFSSGPNLPDDIFDRFIIIKIKIITLKIQKDHYIKNSNI